MALICTENGSIFIARVAEVLSICSGCSSKTGDVALGHDQCARQWEVIQEFSVPVSLRTLAIHLLMVLGKSLYLSVLLFMLQTLWCKGTLLVHLHSA